MKGYFIFPTVSGDDFFDEFPDYAVVEASTIMENKKTMEDLLKGQHILGLQSISLRADFRMYEPDEILAGGVTNEQMSKLDMLEIIYVENFDTEKAEEAEYRLECSSDAIVGKGYTRFDFFPKHSGVTCSTLTLWYN